MICMVLQTVALWVIALFCLWISGNLVSCASEVKRSSKEDFGNMDFTPPEVKNLLPKAPPKVQVRPPSQY